MLTTTDRRLRATLIAANRRIRADRPPFDTGTNVVVRRFTARAGNPARVGDMYQFWFRTRGCTFDRAGQCSMCNYGAGPEIDPDQIARAVRWRMATVPPGAFIYLSPSGSLLDPREVPPELLEALLPIAAARRPAAFAFETRPELCAPEALERIAAAFPEGTNLVCELGVESWDPDVRTLCHLKPSPQRSYEEAVRVARGYGFDLIANLTLGGLGLTDAQAYADALESVRGTRRAGFTTQMVFPLSAKTGTLLGWAHEQGLWQPPTLWMLVRLLAECAEEGEAAGREPDLNISWFNPKLEGVIQSRPDTCAVCRPAVVAALDEFRLNPVRRLLAPALDRSSCDCQERTTALLAGTDDLSYRDRLARIGQRWAAAMATTVA